MPAMPEAMRPNLFERHQVDTSGSFSASITCQITCLGLCIKAYPPEIPSLVEIRFIFFNLDRILHTRVGCAQIFSANSWLGMVVPL